MVDVSELSSLILYIFPLLNKGGAGYSTATIGQTKIFFIKKMAKIHLILILGGGRGCLELTHYSV